MAVLSVGCGAVPSPLLTVMLTPEGLVSLAKQTAAKYALDPELVCAICEQESAWNPWAYRYEPGFFDHYIASMTGLTATEMRARAFSFGLMQVMGEVARENGFTGSFLSQLCDPTTGLDVGCRVFARKLLDARGEVQMALLRWNGGGNPNYPAQVLARVDKYKTPAMGVEESI